MPSITVINRVFKPIVFLLCLVPLGVLIARAREMGGLTLGANPVEELLHELGSWALRFLLLTLAITPLRDLIGKPWPLMLRRMIGLFAFFYVLLHFLVWLIVDQELYWSGILTDIAKRPFITLGFIAFVLLIPLAITSTNGMMRRLGKRWKSLHRLVYVCAILGVWHFYWLVKSDVREPLLYAGILAMLLGWRIWKWRKQKAALKNA
jgi:sulfoxide reductase heme-binding subunit YedZ